MNLIVQRIIGFDFYYFKFSFITLILIILFFALFNCTQDGDTPECASLEQQYEDDQKLFSVLFLACQQSGARSCDFYLLMLALDDRC